MNDFYSRIKEYKSFNKLSYGDLGNVINKSADAFRQALKRESLSDLEVEKLEQYIAGKNPVEAEQEGEIRFEDILAQKFMKSLGPYLTDFQAGHKIVNEQLRDMAELLHELAAQVIELRTEIEKIRGNCNTTDENVKAMNKRILSIHQVIVEQD